MNQNFMEEKPVVPLVFTMSLPMVLSMLVNALYNIVDSFFVARISDKAMTALSLVFPLQNLIIAVGVGFGIGINAATAFFLGAKSQKDAVKAVSQGIVLNLIHGILITVCCIAVMPFFLRWFTWDEEVIAYGLQYSDVVFLFAASSTVGVTFEKVFQAVGRMKVSMFCMMCGCIVNIILDPVLIFGIGRFPAMGVRGAALATGIGQVVTLAAYWLIYQISPIQVRFSFTKENVFHTGFGRLYSVGVPAMLNMALPSVLVTSLNGILSGFADRYVLILGIYYKLQTFIYLTANGMVQGIRPLISFNFGAGRMDRVKKVFHTALISGVAIMTAGTVICAVFPVNLMRMFTDDPETVSCGITALRMISAGFIVSAISVMVSGTFEALGCGVPSLCISLIRYISLIPIAFLLSRVFRENGVWLSFAITELLAAVYSAAAFGRYLNRQKEITESTQ